MSVCRAENRIGQLKTVYYVSEYLTQEEDRLLHHDLARCPENKWVKLKGRRAQNWGGMVHRNGLVPDTMPSWLKALIGRIKQDTGSAFPKDLNHVLVNKYDQGEGIMAHQDGPAYWPVVAIVSLGSVAVLHFYEKEDDESTPEARPVCSVLLEPRSLLVFMDDAYTGCLHGIASTESDRLDGIANLDKCSLTRTAGYVPRSGERISLTCRHVQKTIKAFSFNR
mmetsp:Transcript_8012/g.20547  ORF Transcript_8012/g.20547 Transcript_8012/m.20547 type:complete len:223 (+) Transcript_8012:297-965(+)